LKGMRRGVRCQRALYSPLQNNPERACWQRTPREIAVQTYFASAAPFYQYQFYSICKGRRVNRSAHAASDLEIFSFPSDLKRSAHFSVVAGIFLWWEGSFF
jgi:hypothetical protein